jgi:hypothetical protein
MFPSLTSAKALRDLPDSMTLRSRISISKNTFLSLSKLKREPQLIRGSLRFFLTNLFDLLQNAKKTEGTILTDSVTAPIGAANTDRGFHFIPVNRCLISVSCYAFLNRPSLLRSYYFRVNLYKVPLKYLYNLII